MKIENQVITLEQAKQLRELGVMQSSWIVWSKWRGDNDAELNMVNDLDPFKEEIIAAAFTVAELGVMLGQYISRIELQPSNCYLILEKGLPNAFFYAQDTEAEARATLLIYLLENNLTTAAEVNQRLQS